MYFSVLCKFMKILFNFFQNCVYIFHKVCYHNASTHPRGIRAVLFNSEDTMSRQPPKTTYQQIARLSGVSVATVFRVINNRKLVSRETYEKVVAAMDALDYNHSFDVQTEKIPPRGVIVLVIPEIGNPFYTDAINGIKLAARNQDHSYDIVLYDAVITPANAGVFIRFLNNVHATGVIVFERVEAGVLERINQLVPVVQCSEFNPESKLSYVSIDNIRAAQSAVEYILSRGCTRVAFINGDFSYQYALDRYKGYIHALGNAGIPVNEEWIVNLPQVNFILAVSAVTNLIEGDSRPEAFFCSSDISAAAAIKACLSHGLNVPEDVLIVGFDNIDISVMTMPTITTVNQPKFDLGVTAFDLLVKHINNPRLQPKQVFLNTELILRESSAKTFDAQR